VFRFATVSLQSPQARLDRRISTPSRVFRNMRMAGRMGGERVTNLNLTVHAVDAEGVCSSGRRPGTRGHLVYVTTH
jgi:large subunit ribosomal protein L3